MRRKKAKKLVGIYLWKLILILITIFAIFASVECFLLIERTVRKWIGGTSGDLSSSISLEAEENDDSKEVEAPTDSTIEEPLQDNTNEIDNKEQDVETENPEKKLGNESNEEDISNSNIEENNDNENKLGQLEENAISNMGINLIEPNAVQMPNSVSAVAEVEPRDTVRERVTSFTVGSMKTGTEPWDEFSDYKGNDKDPDNDIVRTFDLITYEMQYAMQRNNVNTKLNFKFELPFEKKSAIFDVDFMSWLEETDYTIEENEGKQVLKCSYNPGNDTGNFSKTLTIAIRVKNLKSENKIKPIFSCYVDDSEIITADVTEVTVSAAKRYKLQLMTSSNKTEDTYDFSTGNPNAANYGIGKKEGFIIPFGLTIQLYGKDEKDGKKYGLRGIEIPEPDEKITFDLAITNTTIQEKDYAQYKPLVWSLGQTTRDKRKDDGRMVTAYTTSWTTPFNKSDSETDSFRSCYNGGNWSYEPNPDGTLKVTISDYKIALNKDDIEEEIFENIFPYANSNNIQEGYIYYNIQKNGPENYKYYDIQTGCISAGELWIVQPIYSQNTNVKVEYSNFKIGENDTILDSSGYVTSTCPTNTTGVVDTRVSYVVNARETGWNISPTYGSSGSGRTYGILGQDITIETAVQQQKEQASEVGYAYDLFVKFDDTFFEPTFENYPGNRAYRWYYAGKKLGDGIDQVASTVYWVAKENGKGWNHTTEDGKILEPNEPGYDDEMINATPDTEGLIFIDAGEELNIWGLRKIKEKYTIIGAYVEYRGVLPRSFNVIQLYIYGKIKNDCKAGNVYMTTYCHYVWNKENLQPLVYQKYNNDENFKSQGLDSNTITDEWYNKYVKEEFPKINKDSYKYTDEELEYIIWKKPTKVTYYKKTKKLPQYPCYESAVKNTTDKNNVSFPLFRDSNYTEDIKTYKKSTYNSEEKQIVSDIPIDKRCYAKGDSCYVLDYESNVKIEAEKTNYDLGKKEDLTVNYTITPMVEIGDSRFFYDGKNYIKLDGTGNAEIGHSEIVDKIKNAKRNLNLTLTAKIPKKLVFQSETFAYGNKEDNNDNITMIVDNNSDKEYTIIVWKITIDYNSMLGIKISPIYKTGVKEPQFISQFILDSTDLHDIHFSCSLDKLVGEKINELKAEVKIEMEEDCFKEDIFIANKNRSDLLDDKEKVSDSAEYKKYYDECTIKLNKSITTGLSKSAESNTIDDKQNANFTIFYQNGTNDIKPITLVDTITYKDYNGLKTTGDITLEDFKISSNDSFSAIVNSFKNNKLIVYYTENKTYFEKKSTDLEKENFLNQNIWKQLNVEPKESEGYIDVKIHTNPTKIKPVLIVIVGDFPANSDIKLNIVLGLENSKPGEQILNYASESPLGLETSALVNVKKHTIKGKIWYDSNFNGIQESNENGIGNVKVELLKMNETTGEYETTHKTFDTQTTDTSELGIGEYIFTDLAYGTYKVKVSGNSGNIELSKYHVSPKNATENIKIDSDGIGEYTKDNKLTEVKIENIEALSSGENSVAEEIKAHMDIGLYKITDFSFLKVKDEERDKTLNGAEFTLYELKCTNTEHNSEYHDKDVPESENSCWRKIDTESSGSILRNLPFVSGNTGEVKIENLIVNKEYKLVETKVPAFRKNLHDGHWKIKIEEKDINNPTDYNYSLKVTSIKSAPDFIGTEISNDNGTRILKLEDLKIPNSLVDPLPFTGGEGTSKFVTIGLTICIIDLLLGRKSLRKVRNKAFGRPIKRKKARVNSRRR